MHRSKIILVLLLLIGSDVSAQINLDSLYSVWQEQAQPDSNRAQSYTEYIWYGFLHSNPDTAIMMANELIEYGKKKEIYQGRSSWV